MPVLLAQECLQLFRPMLFPFGMLFSVVTLRRVVLILFARLGAGGRRAHINHNRKRLEQRGPGHRKPLAIFAVAEACVAVLDQIVQLLAQDLDLGLGFLFHALPRRLRLRLLSLSLLLRGGGGCLIRLLHETIAGRLMLG